MWLVVLLLPGGLLFAIGLVVASLGAALCWPGLRRLTAVTADHAHNPRAAQRPDGAGRDPERRPAAAVAAWPGPPSKEVH